MGREMSRRFVVITAGGSGERFWPVSALERLKQRLCLTHCCNRHGSEFFQSDGHFSILQFISMYRFSVCSAGMSV